MSPRTLTLNQAKDLRQGRAFDPDDFDGVPERHDALTEREQQAFVQFLGSFPTVGMLGTTDHVLIAHETHNRPADYFRLDRQCGHLNHFADEWGQAVLAPCPACTTGHGRSAFWLALLADEIARAGGRC